MSAAAPAPVTREDRRLALAVGAAAVVVVLWNVPLLGVVLFPLRLLTTFAHEAGHGLTAILTGGHFLRFEISGDGSGQALTAGGWRWLILPAGYVGSALFGVGLFVATQRARRPGAVALGAAVGIGTTALLFGTRSWLALVAGLLAAAGFAALSRLRTREGMVLVVLNVVALVMAWNAVLDLLNILRAPSIGRGVVLNDAAAFGEHVGVGGGRLWAFVWLLVVLAILAGGARLALASRD